MTPPGRNGSGPGPEPGGPLDDDDLDDPLDEDEAAAGAAVADEPADETLVERVERVLGDLDGVESTREGDALVLAVGGRAFAIVRPDGLEAALDPAVARAAVRTPDTTAAPRGAGWIAFAPSRIDRFALDRAEAWIRSAHRRATA